MRKIVMICFLFLLLVCGCDKKQKNDIQTNNQKEEIKEEIKVEKQEELDKNSTVQEQVNKEENKQNVSTKKPSTKSNEENLNQKKEELQKEESPKKEPVKEETKQQSIIGTWIYKNGENVYIFEENKLILIRIQQNSIKEYNYRIDENKIVINEETVNDFEVKDDKLYLGSTVLTKAPNNYKYPSIYDNLDIFYGTWKLETPDKAIVLEDGEEKTLEETMHLNKNNMSGFGSCGGSGCYSYIFNFINTKPELYRGSLCYQLVDNNTLSQIKCHSDNIIGYDGWEDQTIHNIIYKRVG